MSRFTLIIDDDPVIRYLHREILKRHGIAENVFLFSNGLEALTYIRDKAAKAASYLVLLDLNMPVMNGWQFLHEINKQVHAGEIQIITISSTLVAAEQSKARAYKDVVDFIEKPFRLEDLRRLRI